MMQAPLPRRATAPPALSSLPLRPAAPVLRRACACGGTPGPTGECEQCRKKRLGLQRSTSLAGPAVAPPIVHHVLGSSGAPLDAGTRAEMEPRFRHSFADVRVHADGAAAESARAVGAHAYTVGSHVVFGAGRYAPGCAEGRRLIAHELTHVVQQRGAPGGADAPLPLDGAADAAEMEAQAAGAAYGAATPSRLHAAPLAVRRLQRQRRQDTHAGMFEMTRHAPLGGPAFAPQAQYDVRIEFLPYDVVNCGEIALTQTLVSRVAGALVHPSTEQGSRALTTAQGTEGVSIDRLAGRTSPLYGVDNTGTASARTHFGSHTPGSRPDRAWLTDTPGFPGVGGQNRTAGDTLAQHFETCAICRTGTDQNAYYGCVSWGYDISAANAFTEAPFARVSKGTPSADFLAAARNWNAQTSPATDDLPIPGHATRNAHMTRTQLEAEITALQTRLAGLAAGHADIPQVTFELRVLRDIREAIRYNEETQRFLQIETRMIQEKVGATPDGTWGYDTIRLVKLWQARHGLTADGRVGAQTLTAMRIYRVGDYPLPDPDAPRPV